MATKKFNKEWMLDNMEDFIDETVISRSRWSIQYEAYFESEGKWYRTTYSVGATEQQDERPYEYEGPEIECTEVHRVEKTISVWEMV